ncbi:hypothetical protein LZ30DRAFT_90626 [Colletotrichum cereale]|nr:hypothetical protein LZ30DRAFT_90626 [Colletotrichum cereale]
MEHDTFSLGWVAQHGAMAFFLVFIVPFLGSCNYSFLDHGTINRKRLYFSSSWASLGSDFGCLILQSSFIRVLMAADEWGGPPLRGWPSVVFVFFIFIFLQGKGDNISRERALFIGFSWFCLLQGSVCRRGSFSHVILVFTFSISGRNRKGAFPWRRRRPTSAASSM